MVAQAENGLPSISVFGAGLIGVYVGGRLARQSALTLIGRPSILGPLEGGLRLTDLDGHDEALAADRFARAGGPEGLRDADLILVSVKSQATEEAAAAIEAHAPAGAVVISLQNGVRNAERLRALLPGRTVLAGMVPYNVAQRAPDHFHRGSAGEIVVQASPALQPFLPLFDASGMTLVQSDNIEGVMWGKLLINLNNAINALSGVSLAEELRQRDFRRAWALSMREALALIGKKQVKLVDPLPVSLTLLPYIMSLPDKLYGKAMARASSGRSKVDPHARSSMADDLAKGRRTEVDFINGEVVRLAGELGKAAPVNARLVELMRAAEAGAAKWEAGALLADLMQAKAG